MRLSPALARFVFRPWFDRLTLRALTDLYFPLSRAWAAAEVADGDGDAFARALGWGEGDPGIRRVRRALAKEQTARHAHKTARAAWAEGFYAAEAPPGDELARLESARSQAAQAWMSTRRHFLPIHLRRRIVAVHDRTVARDALNPRHTARLTHPAHRFPAPPDARMRQTHAMPGRHGRVSWLTWTAPTLGDTAKARVIAPEGVRHPPTIIDLHGIAMELEMWAGRGDPMAARACPAGVRVVRPEGPWHGSRRVRGMWGGEPALAFAPEGFLDLFQAWVAEAGQLIAWARATSDGPVGVAGLSLGALTAQLVASAAATWPRACQPDAAMLAVTSGDLVEVAFEGRLSRRLGLIDRLHAAGWAHDDLAGLRPLLEPRGPPVMGGDNVVVALGTHDRVTPYRGGAALAERWRVPAGNRFVARRGHFSVPLALAGEPAPIDRFVDILRARG